jgi:hypothetical protein
MVLTQKGLLISFDKYQVAPGSEGIVEILVPFKDLCTQQITHQSYTLVNMTK